MMRIVKDTSMTPMRNLLVTFMTLAATAAAGEKVVVYVSLDEEHSRVVLEDFEKETGVEVEARYDTEATKTVGLVNRLLEEKRTGARADVYWNNELGTTIKLQEHGVLEAYVSPSAAEIPARFKDPEGYWTGFAARARILIVNTNLVRPEEMPKGMWDLADPRWRGKACMARPQTGTTATHAAALYVLLGATEADRYFSALAGNRVQWLQGNAHCMREVAAGRFAFGWTDSDDYNVARLRGDPVAMVHPDAGPEGVGVLYIPNSLMLIRGGPHPANGRKLIDWLLRPAIEERLARGPTAQIPLRPGVPVPENVKRPDQVGKAMAVDFRTVGREYDRWVDHARELLSEEQRSMPVLWGILAAVALLGAAAFVFLRRATGEPS
jgi:iron(III) transport system substrate-binding protein